MVLDRDYTVVRPRDSVAVIVLAVNPNSINSFPNGGSVIVFTAPSTEGCYQYKAEGTNAIRSEAFYSSVINNFAQ